MANPCQGDELRINIQQMEALAHLDRISPSTYPTHLVCLLPLVRLLFPSHEAEGTASRRAAHTTLDKVHVAAVHRDAGGDILRVTLEVLLQRWDEQGSCTVPLPMTVDLSREVMNAMAADRNRPATLTYAGKKDVAQMTPAALREWAM